MRTFAHEFWILTGPYWKSRERTRSGLLLAAIIALDLAGVWIAVQFSTWSKLFYQAFQDKDLGAFEHQLVLFWFLLAPLVFGSVYKFYLQQVLEIRWRRWMTEYYVGRWSAGHAYYRLQLAETPIDNPDQRIQEDIRDFVANILSFGLGLLDSMVRLASFCAILWGLSGVVEVAGIGIPGYLVWVSLLYAGVATWLVERVGRPLIALRFRQQQVNANFRYALVRLRENAEGVALYDGEREEGRNLTGRFDDIVANWWALIRRDRRLLFYTDSYWQISIMFPLIVAAPRFFSGAIEYGELIQASAAFANVNNSLSWFIQIYERFAIWRSTVRRLIEFDDALTQIAAAGQGEIIRRPTADHAVGIANLTLCRPDGRTLLRDASVSLAPATRTLITGPSGCGKTTLFRALAGLWPYGSGTVSLPDGRRLLFLPQKPYMPVATLQAAVTFPDAPDRYERGRVAEIMTACGLDAFIDLLDFEDNWSQRLSSGEQQRVAIARALLIAPDWLFLDEATASLDIESEARLYRLMSESLPRTAICSIGHRPSLAAFHHHRLVFQPAEQTLAYWPVAEEAVS